MDFDDPNLDRNDTSTLSNGELHEILMNQLRFVDKNLAIIPFGFNNLPNSFSANRHDMRVLSYMRKAESKF